MDAEGREIPLDCPTMECLGRLTKKDEVWECDHNCGFKYFELAEYPWDKYEGTYR